VLGLLHPAKETRISLRPRWPGLLLSSGIHLLVLLTVPFWSETLLDLDNVLNRSVEDAIELNRRNTRMIWYRLPALPSVRNPEVESARQTARGAVYSDRQIVVDRQATRNSQQLIEQLRAERELEKPVPAENVVAMSPSSAAALKASPRKAPLPENGGQRNLAAAARALEPPPQLQAASQLSLRAGEIVQLPKPPPRKFSPPPPVAAVSQPARSLDFGALPVLNTDSTAAQVYADSTVPKLPKAPPKPFRAPGNAGAGRANIGTQSMEFGATPSLEMSASGAQPGVGAGNVPKLPRRRITAADLESRGDGSSESGKDAGRSGIEAAPALASTAGKGLGGAANLDLVVIGLDPKAGVPAPGANLPGQFSRGREVGPPAHVGNTDPNAARIAGVSSKGSSGETKDLRLLAPAQILGQEVEEGYFEVRLDLAKQWPQLSAPLPNAGRSTPQRIRSYFQGRSVFAVVIPIEKLDRYTADWIVWFSPKLESGQAPTALAANVKMEAPLPIWKLESRRWLVRAGEAGEEQRVQFHVEITREGRVVVKDLLRRMSPALNQMATNDLARWVFQPAKQAGQPIPIDAVIEIPFRVPPTLKIAAQ
jgi:hypothetical protein